MQIAMSDHVWASDLGIVWVTSRRPFVGMIDGKAALSDEQLSAQHAVNKRNMRGEIISASEYPSQLCAYREGRSRRWTKPPHFFASIFYFVSAEVAGVLRCFDLGQGALHPVQIYQDDGVTPVPGECFIWNFGTVKNVISPLRSGDLHPCGSAQTKQYVWPSRTASDDSIAVSRAALEGPDVWVDPMVRDTLFISDPLRSALKKARLDKSFKLFRVPVVDEVLDHSRLLEIYVETERRAQEAGQRDLENYYKKHHPV